MSRMLSARRVTSSERARTLQTRRSLPYVVACLVCVSFSRFIPGVHAQGSGAQPGEQCSDHSDCVSWHGGDEWFRPCLNNHCCSFEVYQSEYHQDPWTATRYSNCTSCGGPFVAPEYDPNDPHAYMGYWGQDGQCDACAPGTRLITEEDNYGGMYWYEPGTCAPICAEGEFLNHDYKCEAKRQAGEWCDGYHSDAGNECSSGMCGYQHCCSEEAVNAGCDRPCDESGVCGGKSYPGESCADHSDCYGDRPCLGGKCCQFDMYSYNSSSHDDEWHNSWATGRFGNCTACGGVVSQGEETSNSDPYMYVGKWDYLFHWENGRCSACSETHDLITQEDSDEQMMNADYMYWLEPGTCREICDEDEYLDDHSYRCHPKKAAGAECWGEWDSDKCASGLCGYESCCSQEAADAGCENPCDHGTGACSTKSMPGGDCSNDSDCYASRWGSDKKCLGGHCCSFDEWQYNNSDPWMGTRYSNCTSCGGPFVAPEYDPNDPHAYMGYWGQDGQCDACAPGTRLITEEDNYGGMYWFEPGTCAPICDEGDYLTDYYACEKMTPPGGVCMGEWESQKCTSGLCGGTRCCSDAAAVIQGEGTSDPQCCTACDSNGDCLYRGECGWWYWESQGMYDAMLPDDLEVGHDNLPDGYPGTSGCELTCEGHGHDQAACDGLTGCIYEDGLCWSAVGSEPCRSMQEVEDEAKEIAEEKRAVADEKRREADALERNLREKERELEAAEDVAEAAGDTLVASVSESRVQKMLEVLAESALSGKNVPIVDVPRISATSGQSACDRAWQLSDCRECDQTGFCQWSDSAGGRRRLLEAEYNVSLGFDPNRVDQSTLTRAMESLRESGFAATKTAADPIRKMRDTDGVSQSAVDSFAASVTALRDTETAVAVADAAFREAESAAADAEADADRAELAYIEIAERNVPATPAATEPPPPPKSLVWDEESAAEIVRKSPVLLIALAAILVLVRG